MFLRKQNRFCRRRTKGRQCFGMYLSVCVSVHKRVPQLDPRSMQVPMGGTPSFPIGGTPPPVRPECGTLLLGLDGGTPIKTGWGTPPSGLDGLTPPNTIRTGWHTRPPLKEWMTLGQVMPRAVCLMWLSAGLSCARSPNLPCSCRLHLYSWESHRDPTLGVANSCGCQSEPISVKYARYLSWCTTVQQCASRRNQNSTWLKCRLGN